MMWDMDVSAKAREYFAGKKVTVVGLGLLGRGVGDTAFIAKCGADVIVTDKKSEDELKPSLDALKEYKNITYRLGEHRNEDFEGRDLILVAAGVPMDLPELEHARERGTPLAMSGALFAQLAGIPVIGVTGTRGKSTVTHMIHHVLQFASGEEVILGGNVRGVSNLQLLEHVQEGSLAVMELDSWQLQGFGWAGISPQVAVFTNFMEDHLNYYLPKSERIGGAHSSTSERGEQESSAYMKGGSSVEEAMDAYFTDKANIFRYQEGDGVLVTTPEVFEMIKKFGEKTRSTYAGEVILTDSSVIPDDCLLSMPGEHNRLNAALAYKALMALSLEEELIFEGLATFPGVPGRLEYLRDIGGVKIFNDNNATTPSATLAGLKALASDKKVVLIMGGAYKDVAADELVAVLSEYVKAVVLLPGSGTDRIREKIDAPVASTLKDAVEMALKECESGDTLLFSPGFASFGLFKNEYDRGDQFIDIINGYESR
jgi:UDP-N-acetylmuramoylalanine--D-glutamate ligase